MRAETKWKRALGSIRSGPEGEDVARSASRLSGSPRIRPEIAAAIACAGPGYAPAASATVHPVRGAPEPVLPAEERQGAATADATGGGEPPAAQLAAGPGGGAAPPGGAGAAHTPGAGPAWGPGAGRRK